MEENREKKKVAVIGGGSWATAIVKILSENSSIIIRWWVRKKRDVDHIKKYSHNPGHLSNVLIDSGKVEATSDLLYALEEAEVVFMVVPAAFLSSALSEARKNDLEGKVVVSAIKGLIPEKNIPVSEYMMKQFDVPEDKVAMISGPSHSEEVAMEKQAYLTIAGSDQKTAENVADMLKCRFINASVLSDIQGVEYAAVLKNVYGIACGLARGLDYGDNFQAVLVSNIVQEINYFLDKVVPHKRDLNASAYLGDLLVTAYSQFSRNRTLGNMIGRGYSVKSATIEMNMVAEGYYAVNGIMKIAARKKIELPVASVVYHVLYEKISPAVEFQLLERKLK